jgi:hypothetical protein
MGILQPSTTNGNQLVLDGDGQNGDARETAHVELAMTALAIGRAIHAAGRIPGPPAKVTTQMAVRGCSTCPFASTAPSGWRIHCRVSGRHDDALLYPARGTMPGCPLRSGPVLVTMEDR